MKQAKRSQSFAAGGIALVDVLANAVAIALLLITTTLVTDLGERHDRESQEKQLSVVLARRLATVLTFQEFPVSAAYSLHDYAECDRRRAKGEVMPTFELYEDHVLIRDTGEEVKREQLLSEENLVDKYIDTLSKDLRSQIRFDIHAVNLYYLTASLLIENGDRVPPHFHFISADVEPPIVQSYEPLTFNVDVQDEPDEESWIQRLFRGDSRTRPRYSADYLPQGVRLRHREQVRNNGLSSDSQGANRDDNNERVNSSAKPSEPESGNQLSHALKEGKEDDPAAERTNPLASAKGAPSGEPRLSETGNQLSRVSGEGEEGGPAAERPISLDSTKGMLDREPRTNDKAGARIEGDPVPDQRVSSTGSTIMSPTVRFSAREGDLENEVVSTQGDRPVPLRAGKQASEPASELDPGNRSDSLILALDFGQSTGSDPHAEVRQYYSGMFTALSSEALRRINIDEAALGGADRVRMGAEESEEMLAELAIKTILSDFEKNDDPNAQEDESRELTNAEYEMIKNILRGRQDIKFSPVPPEEIDKLRSYVPVLEEIVTSMRSAVSKEPPPLLRISWRSSESEAPRLWLTVNRPLTEVSVRASSEFLPRPKQGKVNLFVRPEPYPSGGLQAQLRTNSIVSVLEEPISDGKGQGWVKVMISDPLGLAIYKGYVLGNREQGSLSLPVDINEIEIDERQPSSLALPIERTQRRSHLLAYAATFIVLLVVLFKVR